VLIRALRSGRLPRGRQIRDRISGISMFKTELIKPQRPWKTLSEVELATAE
jgi:hypothetical protein